MRRSAALLLAGCLLAAPSAVPAHAQTITGTQQSYDNALGTIGLTRDQFNEVGEKAARAGAALEQLRAQPEFSGVWFDNATLVVGSVDPAQPEIARIAQEIGAEVRQAGYRDTDVQAAVQLAQTRNPDAFTVSHNYDDTARMQINVTKALPPDQPAPDYGPEVGPNITVNFLVPMASATPQAGAAGALNLPAKITADDFVGGNVFYVEQPGGGNLSCSFAFPAVGPGGRPAMISAGHCGPDGSVAELQRNGQLLKFGSIARGVFTDPGGLKADIAAVAVDDATLAMPARLNGFGSDGVPLAGTAPPFPGAPVCKAGSYTGITCGKITDLRFQDMRGGNIINGFGTTLDSHPGDSGGGAFIGARAVGVQSGSSNEQDTGKILSTNFSSLEPALAGIPGYRVRTVADPSHTVSDAVLQAWNTLGGKAGLGDSLGPARPVKDGVSVQEFERGKIYDRPGLGAFAVYGAVLAEWDKNSAENGKYGFPSAAQQAVDGGVSQAFDGGTITTAGSADPKDAAPIQGTKPSLLERIRKLQAGDFSFQDPETRLPAGIVAAGALAAVIGMGALIGRLLPAKKAKPRK